jgi:PAP2 superfamily protein
MDARTAARARPLDEGGQVRTHGRNTSGPLRPGMPRRAWSPAGAFLLGAGAVGGIELADHLIHVVAGESQAALAQAHALQVIRLETALHIWVEPGIQQAALQTRSFLGLTIGAAQVVPVCNAIYGLGHAGVTLCFALWVFLWRRALFPLLCKAFFLTGLLTLLVREIYPLAPPRLAIGLLYQGHVYHFVDTVFGAGGGVQLGFNQYAAMPSLHMAWAALVGGSTLCMARPRAVRLLGAVYPLITLVVVIVTGNHYLLDAVGALVVVGMALLLARLLTRRVEQWGPCRADTTPEVREPG